MKICRPDNARGDFLGCGWHFSTATDGIHTRDRPRSNLSGRVMALGRDSAARSEEILGPAREPPINYSAIMKFRLLWDSSHRTACVIDMSGIRLHGPLSAYRNVPLDPYPLRDYHLKENYPLKFAYVNFYRVFKYFSRTERKILQTLSIQITVLSNNCKKCYIRT